MKIINIDIKDKIIVRNWFDSDTGITETIDKSLFFATGNYQSILLNFNFISPSVKDLKLFANFRINGCEQIEEKLETVVCDGIAYAHACYVPQEVFEKKGKVLLGVYALKYNNDNVEERISLVPILAFVVRGSYDPLNNNDITPTPTIFEIYFQKIDEALEKIENVTDDEVKFVFPKFWADAVSGDCSLILYKDKVILIDCYYAEKWTEVKEMLDYHGVSRIDYFICSHYHNDHIQNFENLINNGYIDSTTKLYMPAETTKFNWTNSITTYKNLCITYGLNYYIPQENEVLTIDDLKLTFTNCDASALDAYYAIGTASQNNTSTIVLVEHKNIKVLYTGDADNEAYVRLRNLNFVKGQVDLFKIGHHGVNEPTDEEFLLNISPKYAIQPAGINDFAKNNFGNSTMIKFLAELGTKIYPCFMQKDYITFVSDGHNLHCQKGKPFVVSNYYDRNNITLYVDINATSNAIQDGSQAHPFHELMQAIGSVKNYPYNVITIRLADGDYNVSHDNTGSIKNATVIQDCDNKLIFIRGNSNDRTKVTLNGLFARNANIQLQDLTLYADDRIGFQVFWTRATLNNVLISSKNASTTRDAIYANHSDLFVINSKIDKVNNPFNCSNGCNIIIDHLTFGTITGTNFLPIEVENNLICGRIYFDNVDDKLANLERHSTYIQSLILYKDRTTDFNITEATIPFNVDKLHAIEIMARNVSGKHISTGIIHWPTNEYAIPLTITDSSETYTYIQTATITIEDDKFTITNQKQVRISNANGTVEVTSPKAFKIKRIVGYVNNSNYVDLSE